MADLTAVPTSLLTGIADAIRTKLDIANPIKVEDMAMQIGLIDNSSGGYLKSGTVHMPAVSNPNTSYPIVTLTEIGFNPRVILLFRSSLSTVNGSIHITESIQLDSSITIRKSHRWYNGAWANQNGLTTSDLSEKSSGAIYLDGDMIRVNSTTNYNFPEGDYIWIAFGEADISV